MTMMAFLNELSTSTRAKLDSQGFINRARTIMGLRFVRLTPAQIEEIDGLCERSALRRRIRDTSIVDVYGFGK